MAAPRAIAPTSTARGADTGRSRIVSDARGYAYYTSANDHRGRRMFTRTTAPSGTVTESWFVYDDEDKLIGVRHYSGGTVRDEMLFYADGEPVFRMALDNGASEVDRSFLYSDHLGTPRIGVSVEVGMGSPTVTYRAPREPYMASAPVQQNAVPVRLRFPGQWEDVETQFTLWNGDQLSTPLLGNHARTMDPSAGAYTAVEPMWTGGTSFRALILNRAFAYVAGNPVAFVDRTGRDLSLWIKLRNLLGVGRAATWLTDAMLTVWSYLPRRSGLPNLNNIGILPTPPPRLSCDDTAPYPPPRTCPDAECRLPVLLEEP